MKHILSKQNRALLAELVRTDFKLRYQGSVLGYTWSLLRPLLLFVILYVVFTKIIRFDGVPNYPVYLLLGIVLWNFFAEMTSQSLGSIVGRGDLIRKIRIPRWIIIISSSLSAVINLFLNMIIVGVFMAVSHIGLTTNIVFLPLTLLQLYLFSLGISLFLGTLYVKYRDTNYIWEVILQAGFYATPIIYPLSEISNTFFQKLIILNPVAQTIQDARYELISTEVLTIHGIFGNSWKATIPYFITLAVFVLGVLYFKKESIHFAENI